MKHYLPGFKFDETFTISDHQSNILWSGVDVADFDHWFIEWNMGYIE